MTVQIFALTYLGAIIALVPRARVMREMAEKEVEVIRLT